MNKIEPYLNYRESGVPWLNQIPEHWEIRRSKRLFSEIVDKNHPGEALLSVTQNHGLVDRVAQEEDGMRVWNPGDDVSGYKLIKKGDFVISLRSFEGGIEYSNIQGLVSPAYTVVRPQVNGLNRYFKHLLKCRPFVAALQSNSKGIRQGKSIQFEDFGQIELAMPNQAEANAIADFLDTATGRLDALIAQKERLIELLKEKRQALITQAVTKGLDPKAKLKDSGVLWLGQVPEGWDVVRFKDAVWFQEGPGILTPSFADSGIPLLRVRNVGTPFVVLEGCNYVSETDAKNRWSHFRVRLGDVLISCSATTGTVSEVGNDAVGAIPYTGLICLRPTKRIMKDFLKQVVVSDHFLLQIEILKTGTAIQHYGPTHLKMTRLNTRIPSAFRFLGGLALLLVLALGSARAGDLASSAELVGKGIYRYWPAGADHNVVSFALKDGALAGTPAAAPTGLKPEFSKGFLGGVTAHVDVPQDWDLYGTGEVAGPLRRNGAKTVAWNTDSYGYGDGAQQLYESHPWVLAVAKDGSACGILADSTYKTTMDLEHGVSFIAEGPAFPVYILPGASPQEVLQKLAALTGTMPLPPKWALGYHQCRYSYFPEARVREIASQFRARHIPADVIWFDINYMDKYKIFTFDKASFPDPARLNTDLHAQGFHTIWMIDPGVAAKSGYSVYDDGTKRDAWVKASDGSAFKGKVWPGPCVFPDFTRDDVRDWWASLYGPFLANGIDGVWNDMNEPTVFSSEKTMPLDNKHGGFGGGPHARFHNVYGMLMVKATRDGIQKAKPDVRPFVLSRASYIGGQRYGAAWTGDNTANWSHLGLSVPMVLNMGLSGQPFAGPDIGGFIGDGDPKMFARWMGIGALLPFCRAHADRHDKSKEPWEFGQACEDTCRRAIERRYRLMPYLYTVFEGSASSGLPVARPVFFADPKDPALRAEDSSFLLGSDLLVQTQPFEDHEIQHPQPRGDWKPISLEDVKDPDLPVLRLRPGALLPTGPVVQNTGEPVTKLTLYANLDKTGRAEGWLYEDAGDGFGYLKGEYSMRKLVVRMVQGKPVVSVVGAKGSYKGIKSWSVVVL